MELIQCPVCGKPSKLKFKLKFKVFKCQACGLYTSDADFDFSFKSSLEEGPREIGLKQLRFDNFETIVTALKTAKSDKLKGLEVGVGNGWWLQICAQEGIDCTGIEPETLHQDYHKVNGLKVHYSFYPADEIKTKNGYDFIIFNDVFEHIKDLDDLLEALKADLAEDGTLIINLPMSDGFFYRTAMLLHKLGVSSFLTRMWQFNFHSPHMNYFNQQNLKMLLQKHGFNTETDIPLKSVNFATVKERISSDSSVNKFKAAFLSSGITLMKPMINSSNPDTRVFFFKKAGFK
jgi:2-polyprenyl-3-methyl-5-hydroxy-6-metoxy-1,4-benzoquinol methylase